MIGSIRDRRVRDLVAGRAPRRFPPDLVRAAQRRLKALAEAESLDYLRAPPSNRLEALAGDRAGQHSIRINRQWRICFRWIDGAAEDVEIVDYH
jgi:proteic killer suppression protein